MIGPQDSQSGLQAIAQATRLTDLAAVACAEGRPREALVYLRRALALCRTAGDRIGELRTLDALGELALSDLDHSPVIYCEQQLAIYRELGDALGEATTLEVVGHVARGDGRYEEALTYFGAALALYRSLGEQERECALLETLGELGPERGRIA